MILNWANRITIIRILLVVPFTVLMLKINEPALDKGVQDITRYMATVIFLFMAGSDGLDGYIARRKGRITKLGTFLDPTADKLLVTCACLLLASNRAGVDGFLLPPTVVVLIIGKEVILLLGFLTIYFMTFKVHIVPVLAGKASTALQLSMVSAVLLSPEISQIIPGWIWLLRFLWWTAAGCAVLATLVYIRNGIRYIERYSQTANSSN